MPEFSFVARNRKGLDIRGEIEARDQPTAVRRLQADDLTILRLEQVRELSWFRRLLQPIRSELVVLWLGQLAVMLAAGIPMLRCLEALASGAAGPPRFRKPLYRLAVNVQSGYSLSQAMRLAPEIFPPFVVGSVRVGEVSGRLPETLSNCARHLDKEHLYSLKLRGALIYPTTLLTCAGALMALCFTFMVPRFLQLFGDVQVDLPWPTRVLLETSQFLDTYGPVVLATLAGPLLFAGWFFKRWAQTAPGRWYLEGWVMRIPWYGNQFRRRILAGYFRALATLLRSSVPLMVSLDVLVRSLDSEVMRTTARFQQAAVGQGTTLSTGMRRSGMFPPLALEMMRIGEETGNPVPMLERLADFFDEEMTRGLELLSHLLEPIVLLVLGVGVAFLLLAAFLPIYRLAEAF
jgi:type II secretory pathway component PulF